MRRRTTIAFVGIAILCVGVVVVGLCIRHIRQSRESSSGPPPESESSHSLDRPSLSDAPMKVQRALPRFVVTIDDVANHIKAPNVPLCKGAVRFQGKWPPMENIDKSEGPIHLIAKFGATWDGFYIGYELTADAAPASHGKTHLTLDDLKNVRIRYTDDEIEAQARRDVPVAELIDLLRRRENQVPDHIQRIDLGEELLNFSAPLKALMFRGADARAPLLAQVDDLAIRNEIVLALGAVGDERTVAELISRYPRGPVDRDDLPAVLTRVCFSYALCWLTGESIDRSRDGTDLKPDDAEKWKEWWAANHKSFRVPVVKPYATWVPQYPVLAEDHIARIKKMFAEQGDDRSIEYE
jgi:hypothetical protein